MDHAKILKRAFQITWNYRMLWVFGIILALTSVNSHGGGNGGGGGGGGGGSNSSFLHKPFTSQLPTFPAQEINTIIGIVIAVIVLGIILGAAFTILRYVAETALIRLVNQHEDTGHQTTLKEGFRLGWTRSAFRMFLIDLLTGLIAMAAFILLFAIAAAPLLLLLMESEISRALGMVTSMGLGLFVLFVLIATVIVLSLLLQFFHRACVLENLGVVASIQRGFEMVRMRLGDVVIMGVILFALGLAFTIVMIPVILILIMVAVVIGGLPAAVAWFVTSQIASEAASWIAAAVVGLPVFILVIVIPSLLLGGIVEVFRSSTWTLTYRELLTLGAVQVEALPE